MTKKITEALLSLPVGPKASRPAAKATEKVVLSGDNLEAEIDPQADTLDDALAAMGLNPSEWEITGLRKSEWDAANGDKRESVRYTMKKRGFVRGPEDIEDLIQTLQVREPVKRRVGYGDGAYIVALGDMQFGKQDGDGYEGSFSRTIECIDKATQRIIDLLNEGHAIGHVHIVWLGDHVEGFQSQGGANAWRTNLPLTHQMRLTRHVMAYALRQIAPLADRVTVAAVPGNHGEPVRFNGKGLTTYDDSLDTDALVCVMEAAEGREEYGHVEFYFPERDELTVALEIGGLWTLMAHGHQFSPNKHIDWWKGQAFNNDTAHAAGLLLTGHLHHDHIEREGRHLWVGVGSMESESTHFRHRTGATGHPGLTGLHVVDGQVASIDFIS